MNRTAMMTRSALRLVLAAALAGAGLAMAVETETEAETETETEMVIAEAPCGVPTLYLQHNPQLPRVTRALDSGHLTVVVLGTSSTAGAGTSGTGQAFPEQLRQRLAEHYHDVELKLHVVSRPGQTAAQLVQIMRSAVLTKQPDLVIWQTGSTDAVRATPLEHFGHAVTRGLRTLRKGGADVILMDMQYGPFSELLANFRPYRGYLWWVSRQEDVGLLPRHQIMELWSEQGRFELGTENRSLQRANADAIHACLGELLSWMVVDAAERARASGSGSATR